MAHDEDALAELCFYSKQVVIYMCVCVCVCLRHLPAGVNGVILPNTDPLGIHELLCWFLKPLYDSVVIKK